jgi:hypothetical protein
LRRVVVTGSLLVALYACMFAWGAAAASAAALDTVRRTSGDLTTTSSAFVDATGLTLTETTGANRVLVTFSGFGQSIDSTNTVEADLAIDGTRAGGTAGLVGVQGQGSSSGTPTRGNLSFSYLTDVLSAGSHVFKIQWRSATGTTATLFAGAGAPAALSVIEEPVTAGSATSLHDLTDVNDAGKAAGSVLKYDTATSKWIVGTDSTGSGGGGSTVSTTGCDGTATTNTQCVHLDAPIALQQDTVDRLDLLWWGIWFLSGLTLMHLIAPSMERAFRWWQGGLS